MNGFQDRTQKNEKSNNRSKEEETEIYVTASAISECT